MNTYRITTKQLLGIEHTFYVQHFGTDSELYMCMIRSKQPDFFIERIEKFCSEGELWQTCYAAEY